MLRTVGTVVHPDLMAVSVLGLEIALQTNCGHSEREMRERRKNRIRCGSCRLLGKARVVIYNRDGLVMAVSYCLWV
jgi:hypothetical protein